MFSLVQKRVQYFLRFQQFLSISQSVKLQSLSPFSICWCWLISELPMNCDVSITFKHLHQKFQVPKCRFWTFFGYFFGGGPLHKPYIHTDYLGEDFSILVTWNVCWHLQISKISFKLGFPPNFHLKCILLGCKNPTTKKNTTPKKVMEA